MNKKIISILLITSLAFTGLFAAKSAILNANKSNTEYSFIIQYNNAGDGDSATALGLTLDSSEQTTPSAFSVETSAKGNVSSISTFTTTVTTAAFLGTSETATETTTSFPFIVYTEADDKPNLSGNESFSYTATALTGNKYEVASVGTFVRTFRPGVHFAGTIISQFKLSFQGNDEIIAGDYTSTTTIEISTT